MMKKVVWLRKDLRVHDHPALWQGVQRGDVLPVFICPPIKESTASDWWLHQSLLQLQETFANMRMSLIIRSGNSADELVKIIKETGATAIFFNKQFEPASVREEQWVKSVMFQQGVQVFPCRGDLLFHPEDIVNLQGQPYQIFTPFWKKTMHLQVEHPLPLPLGISMVKQPIRSLPVHDLKLEDTRWRQKFHSYWQPGEAGAIAAWRAFSEDALEHYKEGRDFPAQRAVSMLSPYLANGEISPRAVWYAVKRIQKMHPENPRIQVSAEAFLRQLVWREFAHHQLIYHPDMVTEPLRDQFSEMPIYGTAEQLKQWQRGQTGVPIVDAGMRELWETGIMHNRVHMIAGSFLTKHLIIPWQEGSNWFRQTLVDFDEANNAMGWQWVAGCGIDASPYFRIFNPYLQSEKFDSQRDYIRRRVPEIGRLPDRHVHRPHEALDIVLKESGIQVGRDYPLPIVDHSAARKRALAAYQSIK